MPAGICVRDSSSSRVRIALVMSLAFVPGCLATAIVTAGANASVPGAVPGAAVHT